MKNQYRDTGLTLNIGGSGYYYGVFPYTKDYVVNVDKANIVCALDVGYNEALENASWSDIAYISEDGRADQIWKVGDEKEIVLKGDYNLGITVQIAGFNHDNLVDGGKAGITFVSKQVIAPTDLTGGSYPNTNMYKETEKIYGSLPDDLKGVVKAVNKSYLSVRSSTIVYDVLPTKLFAVSVMEVAEDYIGSNTYFKVLDGSQYEFFKADKSNRIRYTVDGFASERWWTRSPRPITSPAYSQWSMIKDNGEPGTVSNAAAYPFCFAFCI